MHLSSLMCLSCLLLNSSYCSWLHTWSFNTRSQIDNTTSYIASKFVFSNSSCLILFFAQILHNFFCVVIAFSSNSDGVKVSTYLISIFSIHLIHSFMMLMCTVVVFSIAFRYRSGPFLATENSTPLSSSGTCRSLHFGAYAFLTLDPSNLHWFRDVKRNS